jgi:Domain of unknown function (DUF397)
MQTPPLDWRRSSLCQTGECVEIATYNDTVVMRSSAHPGSGYIQLTPEEFDGFLNAAKAGKFDLARGSAGS